MKSIYVAASSQHVGKTTCTLGLTASLARRGLDVGYCKPVGQQFVELGDLCVDKDALLFSKVMHFDLKAEWHSPVILGPGATTAYLDDPSRFRYRKNILDAGQILEDKHDLVVYEGTGHPGVGSVVELSNAEVAKMTSSGVIMVVEGGIGSTIDELNRSLALFREHQVPVIGVILNKVLLKKMEKVKKYVSKYLLQKGIPLIGVLPYDKSLSNPIMETINTAVKGRVIAYPERMYNRVENIVSGSLVDDTREMSDNRNILLVVSHRRFSKAVEKVQVYADKMELPASPLSGIIITGDGKHERNFDESAITTEHIERNKIPVITTPLDTLGSMIKINRIEVKINTKTPWKTKRAIELIQENVDLDLVLTFKS